MKFTKMHGCGNDYVYVNGMKEKVEDKPGLARALSDRHFGVGSDGLIFINSSEQADFQMEMYNSDGSRAEMCGNGIRCVAKYVYDKGLTDKNDIRVESGGSVKELHLKVEGNRVTEVTVDMGRPELSPEKIPVVSQGEAVIGEEISVGGESYRMTCVSMGNPHAVVFLDHIEELDLEELGPSFEGHECFPQRVNTEFVKVINRHRVEMRVWERGSGETLACGTGACAVVVACVLNGLTEEEVTVKLLGGELLVTWDREKNRVLMTGPAAAVFEGEIIL